MNLLPARRCLALLALAAPLFLLSSAAAFAVNALILLAAALDAARVPRARLRVARTFPRQLPLDGEADVTLVFESSAPGPVRLRATDDLPPTLTRLGEPDIEVLLPPRGRATRTYRVRAAERGTATAGDIHLRALGPLGLVWRQWREPCPQTVQIQPGLQDVRRHRLLAQRHRLRDAGLRAVRERGEGTAFESMRDYIPGDDPRRIDWKATARRATTTVRQFEAERSQNVLLAIDAGRLMTERIGGRERLDYALSAALLMADVASLQGDRVGAFVFADRIQQFIPPTRAPLTRLADAFARVEGRLAEPDYPGAFAYLAKALRRRSLLVLFTDVIDARASAALLSHLNAAKRRHLPLVVTLRNTALEDTAELPAATEADVFRRGAAEELLQARAHALAAMQRAGVLVADARPRDAIPAVVNRYLEVKRRGLL
ncbi:MAG: DUF58 domain-containing protein [Gemmatimonadetes bacterium]|nr:DUF58 domain-containing protein [Gemmatimonadota bacterium]